MSELSRQRKFKALSPITKRLVSGPPIPTDGLHLHDAHRHIQRDWNGAFLTQISKALNVTITTKRKLNDVFFNISGNPEKVLTAHALLTKLDHYAGLYAAEKNINNPKEIDKTDYGHMLVQFNDLLANPEAVLENKAAPAPQTVPSQETIPDVENAVELATTFVEATTPKQKPQPFSPRKARAAEQPQKQVGEEFKIDLPTFVPANISQAVGYLAMKDPDVSVVFHVGPAGAGKTYGPMHYALEALSSGDYDKIMPFRPRVVTGGKDPGAYPGDAKKKNEPYLKVFNNKIKEILGKPLPKTSLIESLTPDHERGETHLRVLVIIDEAQNLTVEEAMMLQTRMGKGSKFIFTGDISNFQNDLKGQHPGLADLIATQSSSVNRGNQNLGTGMAFIAYTEADTKARHPLMPDILDAYNNPDDEYKQILKKVRGANRNPALAEAIGEAVEYASRHFRKAADVTYGKYIDHVQQAYPALFDNQEQKQLENNGNVVPLYGSRAPEANIA